MKPAKMQIELRKKVDHWIAKGFRVTDRDPLTLCKDDLRVVWNGERFSLKPLTIEPKSYESKPYERPEFECISDKVVLR